MKRIIIAGGRDFHNYSLADNALAEITKGIHPGDVQLISGGAKGADTIGEALAQQYKTNTAIFPAQWDKHGKSAGYIRNSLMADNADILLAFWDGKSKGTGHMIDLAKLKGLEVHIINYT